MICCSDPVPPDLMVDLPGAPYVLVDCPNCGGAGAHLSLHPLYAGAEPCDACLGDGQILVESEGD